MIRMLLAIVAIAIVGVAPAHASATQVRVGQVQILDPNTAQMEINYRCTGEARVFASVSQPLDEIAGGAFAYSGSAPIEVVCTGGWEELTLTLVYPSGGPTYLTPGFANAGVWLSGPEFEDSVDKKVRLT